MVGEPIRHLEEGMRQIIQELRSDPYALETVFVSIIAFAGKAEVIAPLTELYMFYPPVFPIGGGTSLRAALDMLMDRIDSEVQKTTLEKKGDWKPIVFLFTDGNPTDNFDEAADRWNRRYRSSCQLVAVSIGDNTDTSVLGRITDTVMSLKTTDAESFRKFFKWVTATVKTTSQSVNDTSDDTLKLAPTSGINLEKVDHTRAHHVDENFAVLRARCQTTGKDYLVKYARHVDKLEGFGMEGFGAVGFRLVGGFPIDRERYERLSDGKGSKINTMELRGVPSCPHCGNQILASCECGNLFCVGESNINKCPWCGLEGMLGSDEGGQDINRTVG